MRASPHPQQGARLQALMSYGVLDTPRELDFDAIVAQAARICGTPISVVNLIDKDRQWFKAEVGLGVRETPLDTSICAHAILQSGVVEVQDTMLDERFQDNPLVTGAPGLRFYAGALLETEDGLPLGTLCVLDTVPRTLTVDQRDSLVFLARQVMTQLELRRKIMELEQSQASLQLADETANEERDFVRLVTDRLPVRVAYIDLDYRYRFVNDAYERQFGISPGQILGKTIAEVMGHAVFAAAQGLLDRCLDGKVHSIDTEVPYPDGSQWVHATYVPDTGPDGQVRGIVAHVLDVTDQRRMEQTLAKERAHQDETLETARVAVWRWEIEADQVFASRRLQHFFNVSTEEANGGSLQSYVAAIHPSDRMRVADAIQTSIDTGESYEIEYRVTGSDQVERWVLSRGNADFGPDGAPRTLSGIFLDVSDRVRAQEALRESERQRRLALESAEIGAWNIDLATFELKTDARFRAIFGAMADSITYEQAVALIHPDDRSMVRDRVIAATESQDPEPYVAEYRTVHADGSVHWVFARGRANIRLQDGKPAAGSFDGTVIDITDRKRVEQEREILAKQLADLTDNVDQLVWTADPSGYIHWYNRRWYDYTGMTPGEAKGWGWQSVHDRDVLPRVIERWKVSIESGVPFEMEYPIRGADGIYRPFLTRANPIKDEQGHVLRWFGTNTNIQSQKDAEAELERRVQARTVELTRANRNLNEFSYSVAHDLRAPLRAISSTSRILLEDSAHNLRQDQKKLLSRQAETAVRLAGLVDDLLAFGRLTNAELKKEEVDMTSLVEKVIHEVSSFEWAHPCTFAVDEGMRGFGDRKLLTYAVTNLIDNACKFSPKGGTVTVGTADGAFFIRDQGIGFDEKFAHKLFVAFERMVPQEEYKGTGVGLAIVERIVEKHGGTIWAESQIGEGATFYFTLPAEQ